MNNSPIITSEEWDRIRRYIAENPEMVRLDTNEDGTMVVYNFGDMSGVMHPRAYLQIMEETPIDIINENRPIDILKHVSNATVTDALIEDIPGSLHGALVLPWKPK